MAGDWNFVVDQSDRLSLGTGSLATPARGRGNMQFRVSGRGNVDLIENASIGNLNCSAAARTSVPGCVTPPHRARTQLRAL